jgi:hypothetical protein
MTTFDHFTLLTTFYNTIYPENMHVLANQHAFYSTIPLYLPSNPLRRSRPHQKRQEKSFLHFCPAEAVDNCKNISLHFNGLISGIGNCS